MSSGQKRVVINTFERAASADVNALQDNIAQQAGDSTKALAQRTLLGSGAGMVTPGLTADVTALPANGSGTVHDVISGLMVRPDNAGYLLIDPGVVGMVVPGVVADPTVDSNYVVVKSLGVTSTTALTFVANAGPQDRIDIVECQTVDQTTLTASRDIFDPVTQTFVSTSVPKLKQSLVVFRIRQGTINQGFPALQSDWVPLAYVVVHSYSTGFNNCDLYDCRPLVQERQNHYRSRGGLPLLEALNAGGHIFERSIASQAVSTSQGWALGEYGGYQVGGILRTSTPSSSLARFGSGSFGEQVGFDHTMAENRCAGSNAPGTTDGILNAIMLAFPNNLTRCVRYSQVAVTPTNQQATVSGRLPRGPNGILVVGRIAALNSQGSVPPIQLPSQFGASVGVTAAAIVVGWTLVTAGVERACNSTGKVHMICSSTGPFTTVLSSPTTYPTTGSAQFTFTLQHSNTLDLSVDATLLPVNTKRALVSINMNPTINVTGTGVFLSGFYCQMSLLNGGTQFTLGVGSAGNWIPSGQASNWGSYGGGLHNTGWVEMQPPAQYSDGGGASSSYSCSVGYGPPGAGSIQDAGGSGSRVAVLGWEEF